MPVAIRRRKGQGHHRVVAVLNGDVVYASVDPAAMQIFDVPCCAIE
jgi:hypothetical protein